jgi:hypothetical protein
MGIEKLRNEPIGKYIFTSSKMFKDKNYQYGIEFFFSTDSRFL